jgi:hypothetical protein
MLTSVAFLAVVKGPQRVDSKQVINFNPQTIEQVNVLPHPKQVVSRCIVKRSSSQKTCSRSPKHSSRLNIHFDGVERGFQVVELADKKTRRY